MDRWLNKILLGNAPDVLMELPDKSINCCVTSPPYWGLRDYGVEGQLGLEKTPEEYVQKMVEVFREVRRVLRDDGILFLNLGDSYYGSGKRQTANGCNDPKQPKLHGMKLPINGRRASAYGTSDKALGDYQDCGCLCQNLCGVCREVYLRTSRNYDLLVPMLIASLSLPNHENTEFGSDHFSTLDFSHLGDHIFPAILDLLHCGAHAGERLHAFQETMPDEFSRQLLDLCWRRGTSSACLLCGRSLTYNAPGSSRMSDDSSRQWQHNGNTSLHGDQQAHHSLYKDTVCGYCNGILTADTPPYIQPYCTTKQGKSQLKPKDLVGIPWLVAFALRADGWYLRSDIIWAKGNPMPESVTDRPTKAHEYIFLFAKSERYFYDVDAIREPHTHKDAVRNTGDWAKSVKEPGYADALPEAKKANRSCAMSRPKDYIGNINGRNKRTVWNINTKPFSEAHFAVFPPDLIKPCILAGCPEGGIVLDPFMGAGTTAVVCADLGRNYIGIELNPEYIHIANKRIKQATRQARLFP